MKKKSVYQARGGKKKDRKNILMGSSKWILEKENFFS